MTMSWPRLLTQRLADADVVSRSETVFALHVELSTVNVDLWLWLQGQEQNAKRVGVGINLLDPAAGDAYNLLQDPFQEDIHGALRLTFSKTPADQVQCFFFADGLRHEAIANPNAMESSRVILVADFAEDLVSLTCTTTAWTDVIPDTGNQSNLKSPRQFVNDTSGEGLVPISVGTWLPALEGDIDFERFYGRAISQRLARCIASSLLRDQDGNIVVLADLKRRVKATIEEFDDPIWNDPALTHTLIACARWVYVEGNDVDNRHSILCAEIARSFPRDAKWGAGLFSILGTCLESAQVAYRLHLYDKSIDALKLMSDLRKGLADDVKAVAGHTSSLASGLWRDAAVALGAIALKAVMGGSNVLWLTSAYLCISCYLTTRAAVKSIEAIRSNERMFKSKLYAPLLPSKEYEEIAGSRYVAAITEFEAFRSLVSVVYWLAIVSVVATATYPYAWPIWQLYSCFVDHFAHWFGRLGMSDAVSFWPLKCSGT